MKKIAFFLVVFICWQLIGCADQTQNNSKIRGKKISSNINKNSVVENDYTNWKTVKQKNIQFKYPGNWYMKTKEGNGNAIFQLSDVDDTISGFFPLSIYVFNKNLGSYEKFSKNITYEYFIHETDGKNGNLISTERSKFKNFEANDFEYEKNGDHVDITTIDGINKYFMLVNFTFRPSDTIISKKIFNSIIISK